MFVVGRGLLSIVVVAVLLLQQQWCTIDAFMVPSMRHRNTFVAKPSLVSVWMSGEVTDAASDSATATDDSTAETTEVAVAVEEETESAEAPETVAEEAPVVEESTSSEDDTESDDMMSKKKVERERHTMFVGNLAPDATMAQLKELFDPFGKVEFVSIPRDRETGAPRGFAFVDMATDDELQAAVAAVDGVDFMEQTIKVSKSLPKANMPKQDRSAVPEGDKKIYFGNIPFEMTKEDIMEFFGEFGEVKDVYVPTNRETGLGRGFAFVQMEEAAADAAIEAKNGMDYDGRKLVVSVPLPPGEKQARAPRRQDTKIYIGNLAFYTVAETLREIFEEFGEVYDCYLPEDDTGKARGFGFVTMARDAAFTAIDELDGCEIDGRIVRVNEAQPKRRMD